jgi:hypothetical protein
MDKLRYLPTSDELWASTLPEEERKRWEAERKRPTERVYYEAAKILLARGLNPSTCHLYLCREAVVEAKRRLGPDPLIS